MSGLSSRAQTFLNYEFSMETYFKGVAANPYNKDSNPTGIIDMGSSTNGIVNDLIMEKLKTVDVGCMPKEYFNTCEVQGPLRFREKLTAFLNRYTNPTHEIIPDDVIVLAGAGACFEAIGYALINPGDVILVPRPYYYQFDHEFHRVVGAELITFPVQATSVPNSNETCVSIEVDVLREAYERATSAGKTVRSLLVVSPNNPMGYVFGKATMKLCIEFCEEKNIHLISDEIYMSCVFGAPKYHSVLASLDKVTSNDAKHVSSSQSNDETCSASHAVERTHMIWGFAKDFAVAGFRCGVLVTKNQQIKDYINEDLNKRVPTLTLYFLEALISDFNWLDTTYYPTFQKRLAEKTKQVKEHLLSLGVECFQSNAALFVWANFRKYLSSRTFESEKELFQLFMKNGIYIALGVAFGETEPGWFRVITSLEDDRIENGLKRITQALKSAC